ncbi:MAG: helix-turn-helix protein [Candidatus Scalindua rubra]|uniref:Helix-turn-helix protein n=1 Tax=Candidatus Scalindua rubra TaxID=1872076 RepID=A0A1E3XBM1_9BACT|nr:MAG: helix-turn-helix protein [Candidatus Scalindua rubra]
MSNTKIAYQLKVARESLGLTLIEAAKRLGFPNYQTLMKIEEGKREVKASELSKFSRVYFCSIGKLLGEKEFSLGNVFLWRELQQVMKKKKIEAEILYRCEQYHLLEKCLNLKAKKGFIEVSIDDISTNNDISTLAERVSELLALGSRPAFTLQKVLEQDYSVKILFYPIPFGSAVSTVNPDYGTVIVINTDEAPWRRNYDLAHELFHLITWKAVSLKDLEDQTYFVDIEKKANRFASILLLPGKEVRKEITERIETQKQFTYSDLVDIAMEFGVSAQALLYRMANLRFIKWEDADNIAKDEELAEINKQKRKREWGETPESERLIFLAIRCLRKGLISRGKFAEVIGIDRSEIDSYIEKKGLMELEGNRIEIMAS